MAEERITGEQLRRMLNGGFPIAQYEEANGKDLQNQFRYRAEIIKLADGTFLEVINEVFPDFEKAYGIELSEKEALDKALRYSPQGAGATLWSYFSDEAASESLLAPIRQAVIARDSKLSYKIEGGIITGDYRSLLESSEVIYSDRAAYLDGGAGTTISRLSDGRYLRIVTEGENEQASLISETEAVKTVVLNLPDESIVVSYPDPPDGYLRSIFSEDALDKFASTLTGKFEMITPDNLLTRLAALDRTGFILSEPEVFKQTLEALHNKNSAVRIVDVLNAHSLDQDNNLKSEWNLVYLSSADALTGKFLQIKNIVDHNCNVLRVLDKDDVTAAISKLNHDDIVFSISRNRLLMPESMSQLTNEIELLISSPHKYFDFQSEEMKRWPAGLEEIDKFKEAGSVVVKFTDKNSFDTTIYKLPDNTYWEVSSAGDTKPAIYQLPEFKAFEKFINHPTPGQLVTDKLVRTHFTESTLTNYKFGFGLDTDFPLERINAFIQNADKALSTMFESVSIQPLTTAREEALFEGASNNFRNHLTKAFSQGREVRSSTLAFSLSVEFGINATCKNKVESFYCSAGQNGAEHLYQKNGSEIKLVNAVKTEDVEPSTQQRIMDGEHLQQRNQGMNI